MIVTVLNYTTGEVNVHKYSEDVEDLESYLSNELEYDLDNCHWLVTNTLKLIIHEI